MNATTTIEQAVKVQPDDKLVFSDNGSDVVSDVFIFKCVLVVSVLYLAFIAVRKVLAKRDMLPSFLRAYNTSHHSDSIKVLEQKNISHHTRVVVLEYEGKKYLVTESRQHTHSQVLPLPSLSQVLDKEN